MRSNGIGAPQRILVLALISSLIVTVLLGLFLRLQFAGFIFDAFSGLDLRRAHSHLAFYGILFPFVWWLGVGRRKFLKRRFVLPLYLAANVASVVGFLFQGYGPVSIAASTLVLIVWLLFAYDLLMSSESNWEKAIPIHVVLSSIAILLVAVNARSNPPLSAQLARGFLCLLLFGILIPSVLSRVSEPFKSQSRLAVGSITTLCVFASAYLSGTFIHWSFGLMTILFGIALIVVVVARGGELTLHLRFHWIVLNSALVLAGSGILNLNHSIAIAGIHYLALGPVALTFLLQSKLPVSLKWIYEGSVLVMVSSIALQALGIFPLMTLQTIAAASGAFVVGTICLMFVIFAHNAWRLRSQPIVAEVSRVRI